MTKTELKKWFDLRQQIVTGYHLSDQDKRELLQLNHKVMEAANQIHNSSMLETRTIRSGEFLSRKYKINNC